MSDTQDVVLYEQQHGAAVITINRPEQRNALNNEVLAGLVAAVERGAADREVSSLVLRGAGDRAFCAGGALKEMGAPQDALAEHQGRGALAGLLHALWGAGKPTIARVEGYCLAGGFGVALARDIFLATPRAVFGAPEVKVGLWPYMITVPLIRSMPPKQALRLMMTGERVDGGEGRRLAFVTEVVASRTASTSASVTTSQPSAGSPRRHRRWTEQLLLRRRPRPGGSAGDAARLPGRGPDHVRRHRGTGGLR